MRKFIEVNGKLLEVTDFKEVNGHTIPIVKATATEKLYPNGRKDVTIHVPCLKINNKLN